MKKALIVIVGLYVFAAVLLGILWVFGAVDANSFQTVMERLAIIAVVVAAGWVIISTLVKSLEK